MTGLTRDQAAVDSAHDAARPRSVWIWVSRALLAVGLAWTVSLVLRDREALRQSLDLRTGAALSSLVLITFASFHIGLIYRWMVEHHANTRLGLLYTCRLYFLGQLARHLPGRIWGVLFQVGETRGELPAVAVVRTGIDLTLVTLAANTLAAVTLIAYARWGLVAAATIAAAGSLTLFAVMRADGIGWTLRRLSNVMPTRISSKLAGIPLHSPYPTSSALAMVLVYASSWVVYVAGWSQLGNAITDAPMPIYELCGYYTLAWLIGFLVFLTPGGLGVREPTFIVLAAGLVSSAQAALLAILARVAFLLADLLLAGGTLAAAWISRPPQPSDRPPVFDERGFNVFDPNDRLGYKTEYISKVQSKALERYAPRGNGREPALDVGCGYGRISPVIASLGWRVIGIDPDRNLLEYAKRHAPEVDFCQAGLPDLPIAENTVGLMVFQNVLRGLLLYGELERVRGLGRYIAPGGNVVVVDNIRDGDERYIPESELIEMFRREGLELEKRVALRAARWWVLFPIRYGLVPRGALDRLADYELAKRRDDTRRPTWQYLNVLFHFRKPS